jgi:hypothetical protein
MKNYLEGKFIRLALPLHGFEFLMLNGESRFLELFELFVMSNFICHFGFRVCWRFQAIRWCLHP